MEDAATIELADRLLAELPALLNPGEVAATAEELSALIERGRDGEPVDEEFLGFLHRHPSLHGRATELAGSERDLGLQPPPGPGRAPMPPRYVCPRDGYEWFRLDLAEPVPACPNDGTPLVRDHEGGTSP
ncbi:hypothetical protein [Nonomuraea sp. JJY05]|jgi:hypothetical protein|uniref:hypothetical protein n=1 Tax=Nonomuraea sp. JJY05 TaxID=3350255 RepID=UPI00373E005C